MKKREEVGGRGEVSSAPKRRDAEGGQREDAPRAMPSTSMVATNTKTMAGKVGGIMMETVGSNRSAKVARVSLASTTPSSPLSPEIRLTNTSKERGIPQRLQTGRLE